MKEKAMPAFALPLLFACLLLLTGCKTSEELVRQDEAVCRGLGVPVGSDAYWQCVMAQDQLRTQRQQATSAEIAQRGAAIAEIARDRNPSPAISPSTTCTTSPNISGGSTLRGSTTTCR
jgi:hypothetical protein